MSKSFLNRLIPTLLVIFVMVAMVQAAEEGQKPTAGCSCGAVPPRLEQKGRMLKMSRNVRSATIAV